MELIGAIKSRHSVRKYTDQPVEVTKLATLRLAVEEANAKSGLNIQLVVNEPKAFGSKLHTYGTFFGVKNYLDSLAVHPDYRRMGIGRALLEDGIRIGLSGGFTQVALVVDAEMPRLTNLYASIGFVPADHRHAFGTDFLRMIYKV